MNFFLMTLPIIKVVWNILWKLMSFVSREFLITYFGGLRRMTWTHTLHSVPSS